MPLDTIPKLRKKTNVAFATETTTGTPISLVGSNGTLQVFNRDMKYNPEVIDRESQGASLSNIVQDEGARPAVMTFESKLFGQGTGLAPIWLPLIQACGCAVTSGVITPTSSSIDTITLGMWIDGRFKLMSGCMGTFTLTLKRGQPGMFKWTFYGVQQPVTDAANIAPTYVTTPKAPRVGATFSFAGITPRVADVVFDAGNQVIMREDISAVDTNSDPTGFRSAIITGRKPMFKFAPEALPLSSLDLYNLQKTMGLSAFSLAVGSVTDNTFTIAAPQLQVLEPPQDADRQGLYVDDINCLATRNTSAGDDEWSITLT